MQEERTMVIVQFLPMADLAFGAFLFIFFPEEALHAPLQWYVIYCTIAINIQLYYRTTRRVVASKVAGNRHGDFDAVAIGKHIFISCGK